MYVSNELQIGDKDWLSFVAQMQMKAKKPLPLTKENAKLVAKTIRDLVSR